MITRYSLLQFEAGATKQQIESVAKKLDLTPDEVLVLAHTYDPTGESKFEAWILKQMGFKNIRLPEDGTRLSQVLKDFISLSNKKQLSKRDIQQYKTIHELETEIDGIKGQEISGDSSEKLKEYLALPGVEIFGQNNEWLVLSVSDPESASKLAAGTKWCTSSPDTAEGYIDNHFLLVMFKKMGTNIEKMYQATADMTQFMDLKDSPVKKLDNSLGLLLINLFNGWRNDVDEDLAEEIDGYLNTLIAVCLRSEVNVPELEIETMIQNLHPMEVWELIEDTKKHVFREAYLIHPAKEFDYIESYIIFCEQDKIKIPRWKEFEETVERGDSQLDIDIEEKQTRDLVLRYLINVEKFGRWEAIDNHLLNLSDIEEDGIIWFGRMVRYLRFNDGAGHKRWPEFEAFIQKLLDMNIDLGSGVYDSKWYVLMLAVEYWRMATPVKTAWPEMEDAIFEDGHAEKNNALTHGYYSSPVKEYMWHRDF